MVAWKNHEHIKTCLPGVVHLNQDLTLTFSRSWKPCTACPSRPAKPPSLQSGANWAWHALIWVCSRSSPFSRLRNACCGVVESWITDLLVLCPRNHCRSDECLSGSSPHFGVDRRSPQRLEPVLPYGVTNFGFTHFVLLPCFSLGVPLPEVLKSELGLRLRLTIERVIARQIGPIR